MKSKMLIRLNGKRFVHPYLHSLRNVNFLGMPEIREVSSLVQWSLTSFRDEGEITCQCKLY